VGENRKKKHASARPGARAKTKRPAATQIVVTLSLPKGEVVSVEKLAKSGKRHEVSQKEFAALAGGAAMQDFGAALEEIYAAGVSDAIDDGYGEMEDGDEIDRLIMQEAAGREIAKRGVRKMVVRRVLRREMMRKRAHARRQPAHKDVSGPHSHA
jgi:hypothetical protein